MPKLYKLAEDLETAYQLLSESVDEETGEINPEALDLLIECKTSFEDKIAGLAEFIKRLKADYEAYKAEETRLCKYKKATEKKIDWLKGYIRDNIVKFGRDKLETTSCKVCLGTSSAVNVFCENEIPVEYKTIEETVKIDKKAISQAIKSGVEIPGAEIVENINVRIS